MKKWNIFIILLSVIDVVLLAVIVTSLPSKVKVDGEEKEVIEASVEPENLWESHTAKSEIKQEETSEAAETTNGVEKFDDVNEKTNEEALQYDVEGIDGIVDIEDEETENAVFGPDLATTERPGLSDFMWYFDGVHYTGIPDGVTYVYDSQEMEGDWKGFIFLDPERKFHSYALQFLNVHIDIEGQRASVVFDMYQYCPENSEIFDMNGEIQKYSGNFESGAVYATGAGNVHIDNFYYGVDNRQYATGYLDTPDGTPAYLALVRP